MTENRARIQAIIQVSAKWRMGPRAPEWGILWQRILTETHESLGVLDDAAQDGLADLEPDRLNNCQKDVGLAE